jgi:hypothetical protein
MRYAERKEVLQSVVNSAMALYNTNEAAFSLEARMRKQGMPEVEIAAAVQLALDAGGPPRKNPGGVLFDEAVGQSISDTLVNFVTTSNDVLSWDFEATL